MLQKECFSNCVKGTVNTLNHVCVRAHMHVCIRIIIRFSFVKQAAKQCNNCNSCRWYTYTYDNSRHGNNNGKVNYVADNKMPQQMAFHGVVLNLLFTQQMSNSNLFLVHMLYNPPTCHKHNCLMGYQHACIYWRSWVDSTLKHFFTKFFNSERQQI